MHLLPPPPPLPSKTPPQIRKIASRPDDAGLWSWPKGGGGGNGGGGSKEKTDQEETELFALHNKGKKTRMTPLHLKLSAIMFRLIRGGLPSMFRPPAVEVGRAKSVLKQHHRNSLSNKMLGSSVFFPLWAPTDESFQARKSWKI